MPNYLFPPPPIAAAAIQGTEALFPIRRIFCVGRNYEAHAREVGTRVDRETPFFFTKSAHSYVPSGATVAYPPGTANYHYELEWVAAIGRSAFQIDADGALDAVLGYACGLDMTRRDLQSVARERSLPWDLSKDFESSAVLSPIRLAAPNEHRDRGAIELRVNGATRQRADIGQLIHPLPALIAYLSRYYHLLPGDLIYTGTPAGVGPLQAGDRLVGSIEGVGEIALTIGPAER